jgi:hypothetical protein
VIGLAELEAAGERLDSNRLYTTGWG